MRCDAGDVALLRVASVGQAPETDEQDHDGGQHCETDPDAVDGCLSRATPQSHQVVDWGLYEGTVGEYFHSWECVQCALRRCKQGPQNLNYIVEI